ncbi:hypothetical protein GQ600_868 [Phytophthora cactorum]|nr:hypothetical protein GQ600_868 [Phytophthora cactorum]
MLLSMWTGQELTRGQLKEYKGFCASRKAPPLTNLIRNYIHSNYGDEESDFVQIWKRIWWLMCTVCITQLWVQRNQVDFNGGSEGLTAVTGLIRSVGAAQSTQNISDI